MSEWKAKRFWSTASTAEAEDGYIVELDARELRTPLKSRLVMPTLDLAEAVAAEWDAQHGEIDPLSMPVTRAANSAIDKVGPQRAAVIDELAGYGETDLLCYRAGDPAELVARQAAAWDPWLVWSANALDAPLTTQTGLMPVDQPPASLIRLRAQVAACTDFKITGLHDLVAISGSLVLALAVAAGKIDAAEAWSLARIDEDWQIEQWGEDDEATAHSAARKEAFLAAARFYRLSTT